MAVTVISRALVGSCPQVSGTWHTGKCRRTWRHDIDADTSCADQPTFGFGLSLAAGSYLTRAKRRAPVLTWACALYGAILCVAALSSSLLVFLLLIGCATGIGVFINAGETMIETG